MKKAVFIIVLVLMLDQISKIYVKTNFLYGEDVFVFDWFRIHFIENNGMAWGAEFGGKAGKLFLTIFRLLAITGIGYWLFKSVKKKCPHNFSCGNFSNFCRCYGKYYRFSFLWSFV